MKTTVSGGFMSPQLLFTPHPMIRGPGMLGVTAKILNIGFPLLAFMLGLLAGLWSGVLFKLRSSIEGFTSVKLLLGS